MTTSINRSALLKACSAVRPALAAADYIPALTHILFRDGFATAYNDINAIVVSAPGLEMNRCIPGDLLIRTLSSFGGEAIAMTFDPKTNILLLASGRSKIKLPTLSDKDFPFEVPDGTAPEITLTLPILKGIEKCLTAAGTDSTHPAQMGVTLETDEDGCAVLYSTDSTTISRYQTADKITLPGDVPVILPTFLCDRLSAVQKDFPQTAPVLVLLPGALLVDFVEIKTKNVLASIFSKTLIDLEPVDFGKVIKRYCNPKTAAKDMRKIPDALDAAFGRAMLVLGNEPVKTTRVKMNDKSMSLFSTSAMGDCDDDVVFDAPDAAEFLVDPELVVRGLKQCTKVTLAKNVLLLGDETGNYLHMVSHVNV
jgi:hypothetical protein